MDKIDKKINAIHTYAMLCSRVRRIDKKAAKYMIKESIKLKNFVFCSILSKCFVWSDTRQGHVYWNTIDRALRGKV